MKIIKVACCKECPHMSNIARLNITNHVFSNSVLMCTQNEVVRDIGNIEGLPQWCPLPEEV